jgi:hypothetical protein
MTIRESQIVNEANEEGNNSTKSNSTTLSIDLQLEDNEISKIWNHVFKTNPNYFQKLLKDLDLSENAFSERKCIYCQRELNFENFFYKNASLTLGKAWDIWGNKKIKFYCLECKKDS